MCLSNLTLKYACHINSGESGVGIEACFNYTTLVIKNFDPKKNEFNAIEIPNSLVKNQWQWICIVHTHRQIRGSKIDVYINSVLRLSSRFSYPNVAQMSPTKFCSIAMNLSSNRSTSIGSSFFRAHFGPVALFAQPLSANVIQAIKSVDDYDTVVLQFNSYISSSTSSSSTISATSMLGGASSSASGDGLIFAYDARNCDRLRGLCFDSSENQLHAEATGAGIRLRTTSTFKESIWQLGGPVVFLPLLLSKTPQNSQNYPVLGTSAELAIELKNYVAEMVSRPMGIKCIPKVICLFAEILRHSPINKVLIKCYIVYLEISNYFAHVVYLPAKPWNTIYVTSHFITTRQIPDI